jgi:hypothetical protein
LLPLDPASSEVGLSAMAGCSKFAFSTEQSFTTNGPLPADGDPIISEGDLLGLISNSGELIGTVCARNTDLLQAFDINRDIGLDAVDVMDTDRYLVAFSTELDSPNQGQFTAGDLLITNGAILPNKALTNAHDPGLHDLGLDALHFKGAKEDILSFLDAAAMVSRSYWLTDPGLLANELTTYGIDIWFSTEGTSSTFLDGDLLSAASGDVIARNDALLPIEVPAGIPVRGVDFGLDAATGERNTDSTTIYFSTELYFNGTTPFSNGDVLESADGTLHTFPDLISAFEPAATSLGLDALYIDLEIIPELETLFLPLIMRDAP